jgi:hypothetical protein
MKDTVWNIETLKEYFTSLIEGNKHLYQEKFIAAEKAVESALIAQKDLTNAAFASSEKAIVKAEDAQRDYNVRSNEFRGQLDDQAQTLMPRIESMGLMKSLEDKVIVTAKANADKIDILSKKLEITSDRLTIIEGKGSGMNALWGYIIGALGIIALLYSLIKQISSK